MEVLNVSNLAYKTTYTIHNTQIVVYKRKPTKAERRRNQALKKQRLAGFGIVLFALVIPFICGDATASIFFLSVGVPLMFTRKVL
jgi:hypothetical protein